MREAQQLLTAAEKVIAAQQERIAQLENLALTDELTGVLNRRGLMLALKRELAAAARNPEAQGMLVMVDLDGFKAINDTQGHNAGDAYLQTVATALQTEVRPSDVVARLGGDEFAVLLKRIDEPNGLVRLARMEHSFHTHSLTWQGKVLPLRASFGAALYDGLVQPEAVLASADLRLYAQKSRRR
ncbi:MAG: GGDEF domain-containing protein [Alphaproteobacteria bacterium]|nr:GGDEF domain-containing protein [Alphaproteobacteria bacterium]